VFLNCNFK